MRLKAGVLAVAGALLFAILRLYWPVHLFGPAPLSLALILAFPAAWYGGLRAGLAATLLCTAVAAIIQNGRFVAPSVQQVAPLGLLALTGAGASLLCERIHVLRRELRQQRETLDPRATALLLDSVRDSAICSLDPDGYLTGWNSGAALLFGSPAAEMLGRHFCRLYTDRDMRVQMPERELAHAADFGTAEGTDWRLRADGTVLRVRWSLARVLGSHGEISGFLLTARDVTEAERQQDELRRSLEELRDLARHLHAVRESERGRIAQEMHDELGQSLACLKMELSGIQDLPPEELAEVRRRLLDQLDGVIRSMRRLSTELRPLMLDNLGLAAAVEWQAGEFQSHTGIACKIRHPLPEVRLDRDRANALFRIFQEALTNVARHARATEITVELAENPAGITLQVSDNGSGFSPQQNSGRRSMGLVGMRERALTFGGQLFVESAPGEGTRVRVWIPADAAQRAPLRV